jgi:hypothetical protein
VREAATRRVEEQPRRLDCVTTDGDRVCGLEALGPVGVDVRDAGAAAGLVDVDTHRHRVRAHLDAVFDRVGEMRDERARLRIHLAALYAEPAVDAVRPVAEHAVGDRDRTDTHLDAEVARALPRDARRARDRMRAVRVAVGIPPRPVLPRHRQLELEALERLLQVPVRDRPVDRDSVPRTNLEVGGMEPRRIAREVRHRAADADARVVLAHLDRIVARDDPLVRPVEAVRSLLVAHPVAIRIPERALLEDHDPPPGPREPLRERDAAGTRADHEQVDRGRERVVRHAVEVLQPSLVLVEQERRVVVLRHQDRPLDDAHEAPHSSPRSCVSCTGSRS